MVNSRRKGHSFERTICKKIKHLFPDAKRLLEYQEGFGIDIANTGNLLIQCKNKQQYVSINTINEIPKKKDGVRCLITKANQCEPMVVLSLDDFLSILEKGVDYVKTEGLSTGLL